MVNVSAEEIAGRDWSESEIDLIVADYFDMRDHELKGALYIKAQRNFALQELTGRSKGSIEFKHQNISAILMRLGEPWILGYKPMANFQRALLDGVERRLSTLDIFPPSEIATAPGSFAEEDALFIGPPPITSPGDLDTSPALERLVRKFDPAARDEKNRALGARGEAIVFANERARLLSEGRADLARRTRWVSRDDGDGAGYDILSYDASGKERLVEVKTTGGYDLTPFYISENERALSEERPDAFRLIRVYDAARAPRAFELQPPLQNWLNLQPVSYRASVHTFTSKV